jgi:hypothetical protein
VSSALGPKSGQCPTSRFGRAIAPLELLADLANTLCLMMVTLFCSGIPVIIGRRFWCLICRL